MFKNVKYQSIFAMEFIIVKALSSCLPNNSQVCQPIHLSRPLLVKFKIEKPKMAHEAHLLRKSLLIRFFSLFILPIKFVCIYIFVLFASRKTKVRAKKLLVYGYRTYLLLLLLLPLYCQSQLRGPKCLK